MLNPIVTELVTFASIPEMTDERFIEIVHDLEVNFHMHLPGYLNSELVKGNNGQWGILMHWASREALKDASRLMMQSPVTEAFRKALDPKSVNITVFDQRRIWNAES
ncbi:hypothetical protein U14_01369 [Candidatus Moduliflexus flocculans]|uniref:ABM domain-containing protein n=1 Tax=Candidatus Moduliflexus flocculans TaxID=1499966 RepID=A0A0S6VYT2_9BACT|nr:hypothetical protein U14_01369 [Candidatus Moduliflexus flocculans]